MKIKRKSVLEARSDDLWSVGNAVAVALILARILENRLSPR
jgi:hypothetical protein